MSFVLFVLFGLLNLLSGQILLCGLIRSLDELENQIMKKIQQQNVTQVQLELRQL